MITKMIKCVVIVATPIGRKLNVMLFMLLTIGFMLNSLLRTIVVNVLTLLVDFDMIGFKIVVM